MPSPFPGMDPYLEGPLWTSVHSQLAVEIARQLTPRLVPRYAALTERRVVMVLPDIEEAVAISTTGLRPDTSVVSQHTSSDSTDGGAVIIMDAPVQLETVLAEPVPQLTVEIRDTENRQLVTAIEVLSPWNKRGEGRQEYLLKRQRLLASTAHLMEIDLLRTGDRVPMRQPLPVASYFVFLSRVQRRPITDVWPIQLEGRLPEVPVPLLPGDADVSLNLQAVFSSVYDGFGYQYLVDYSEPPKVSLSPQQWAWAQERLGRPSAT